MRRLILIGLGLAGAAGAAFAGSFGGDVTLGGQASFSATNTAEAGYNNAKYREYWYDMHAPDSGLASGDLFWTGSLSGYDAYLDGSFGGRSGIEGESTDGGAAMAGGVWGKFKLHAAYTRIGHNFAYQAASLYNGIGTGRLTLVDPGIPATFSQSTTMARASVLQNDVNTEAVPVDIGLKRDRVNVGLDVTALEPWTASFNVDGERRVGSRPYGGDFGFSDAIELAEPIDYDTLNLSGRLVYADRLEIAGVGVPLAADVGGAHSTFQNHIEALQYDNILLSATPTTPNPLIGQNSLAPSNHADTVSANLSAVLPLHVRLAGHGTISRLIQDETLLPQTVNATIVTPIAPSRDHADTKVLNAFYQGSLTFDPVERAPLTFKYAYREHNNQSPDFFNLTPVFYDASIGASATTVNVSSIERTLEVEQAVDIGRKVRVTSAFEHEHSTFVNGSADTIDENRFKLACDTQALDWASVRVSGEHAVRDSDYPDYTSADGELPWNRKFYAASRDQDLVTVMTTIQAADDFTVTVEHTQGVDSYPQTVAGLQKENRQASTIDLAYEPGAELSLSTYYTLEAYHTTQASRQWNPGGTGDPYGAVPGVDSPSNWSLDSDTTINTAGLVSQMAIVPERVFLRLNGSGSVTRGKLVYTSENAATSYISPVSPTNAGPYLYDANPWTPEAVLNSDATESLNAGVSLTYKIPGGFGLGKLVTASVGYRFDLWHYQDDLLDGYTGAASTAYWGYPVYNSLLSMDTPFKSYQVHTVFAQVGMAF